MSGHQTLLIEAFVMPHYRDHVYNGCSLGPRSRTAAALLHPGTREDSFDHCMFVAGDIRDQYQSYGLLPIHIAINEVIQFAI